VVFIIVPYFTGHWHSSNVHWTVGTVPGTGAWGGVKIALVYLFIMGWSCYGTEVCATFAPEYRDTRTDTRRALVSAAMFSMLVYTLLPLGLGGITGAPSTATAEGQYYVVAFKTIAGSVGSSIFLICLIASMILSMSTSTGDAGRALYGISRSGMTLKLFGKLNRFHVPGNAMTMDLIVNTCLVLFVSSNLAILYLSNIGYILCHVFAMSGLLLLRKDRPNWPRPIRLGNAWLPVVAFIGLLDLVFFIVGAFSPKYNGYGDWKDFGIGMGILVGSLLLFFYRRIVEDGEGVHLREETPAMPEGEDLEALIASGVDVPRATREPVVTAG
jgi:amino acid transporter